MENLNIFLFGLFTILLAHNWNSIYQKNRIIKHLEDQQNRLIEINGKLQDGIDNVSESNKNVVASYESLVKAKDLELKSMKMLLSAKEELISSLKIKEVCKKSLSEIQDNYNKTIK